MSTSYVSGTLLRVYGDDFNTYVEVKKIDGAEIKYHAPHLDFVPDHFGGQQVLLVLEDTQVVSVGVALSEIEIRALAKPYTRKRTLGKVTEGKVRFVTISRTCRSGHAVREVCPLCGGFVSTKETLHGVPLCPVHRDMANAWLADPSRLEILNFANRKISPDFFVRWLATNLRQRFLDRIIDHDLPEDVAEAIRNMAAA